jgi:hypothetical protein
MINSSMATITRSLYSKTLDQIGQKLLAAGIYRSQNEFLKDLLERMASDRIRKYKTKIKRYERRYGSFSLLTKLIENKASPKKEDIWMDWESSRDMLRGWERASKELGLSAAK